MLNPIHIRLVGNGKTVEQLTLAVKYGMDGGHQQRLTETARTREEIVISALYQLIYQLRLINIKITILTKLLKILYAYR